MQCQSVTDEQLWKACIVTDTFLSLGHLPILKVLAQYRYQLGLKGRSALHSIIWYKLSDSDFL